MKNYLLSIFILSIIFTECTGKKNKQEKETDNDSSHFFQTSVIFQRDINEVDSTPFFIYKISTVNDKRDSSAITTAIFKQFAAAFLKPDISSPGLKSFYKESIFEDKTTGSFTINYSTLNKALEIQSVDILLKDDGKTVKNIFIRKFFNYTDSSAIEQLSWKPHERFQIVRSVQRKNKSENNTQTTIVWNEKGEEKR